MDELASSPLRLRVLGGFQLTGADGADLSPPGKKLRALVALLAMAPVGGWPRERLTAMLWGDRDEEQARGSLRQALAELRRSLGDQTIQADRDTVGFNPGAVSVDAQEFASLAATGDPARAGALYGGDLLDGVSLPDADFGDWLLIERTRLHDAAVGILGRLLALQSGEEAAITAQRLLHLDPTNEEAHRALMRHYQACGDRAHALRQFQLCRDALQRDLGVKPEAETERLYRELQLASSSPGAAARVHAEMHRPVAEREERGNAGEGTEPKLQAALSEASATHRRRVAKWAVMIPVLAVILTVGAVPAWRFVERLVTPAPQVSVQGIPILVVLPFKDLTGTQSGAGGIDYGRVGAGIAEEFTTDLSAFPELQVVSSASAAAYADKPIPEIAEKTGATFVIEGSIRHVGNTASVLVQLIDARKDTYSKIADAAAPITDPVSLQKSIVASIRDQLAGMTGLFRKELERIAWSHGGGDITEYDYYVRGHSFSLREPNDWPHAYEQWSEGLKKYPDSVLLRCKLMIYDLYSQSDVKHAQQLFDEATALKKKSHLDEWYYLWVAARLHSELGDHRKAVEEARAAIAMAPYDTLSHNNLAWVLYRAGRYDEALEWFKFAATDPHPKRWYFDNLGLAYGGAQRWPEAVDFALAQIEKNPPSVKWWYDFLGMAYMRSGQYDKSQEAWKKASETLAPPEL